MCLFALFSISCSEEEESKPEGDLSKVYIEDITYRQVTHRELAFRINDSIVADLNGDRIDLGAYGFVLYHETPVIENIIVEDTVVGDTIRIFVSPDDYAVGPYPVYIDFTCTIRNIPKNKVFYLVVAEEKHSRTMKFSTK